MGFTQTAGYFEARAKRARNADDQRRFWDEASFYKKLATISPSFPPGCSGATPWSSKADVCRTIAHHLEEPGGRDQMLWLADSYDALSQAAE